MPEIPPEILNHYVAYNPFPECIMCGRLEDIYEGDDPVIRKQLSVATLPAAERFKGIELEADGSVAVRSGLGLRQPPAPGRDQLVHLLRAV